MKKPLIQVHCLIKILYTYSLEEVVVGEVVVTFEEPLVVVGFLVG